MMSDGDFRSVLPPATPLRELAREQGVRPFGPHEDVRLNLWDTDEEFDAFLADIHASRQDDLA